MKLGYGNTDKGNKNRKQNKVTIKGITLIALVITIIVLLILAGVSIAMLTGQNGILNQANKAKQDTENAKIDEQKKLVQLEANMNLENKTYTDKNGAIVTIPAGFAVSDIEEEKTIDNGLVVIDKNGNEFVWIPVETVISDTESNGTVNKAMAIQDGENYKGLLYDFVSSGSIVRNGCTTTTTSIREPDIVSDYDNNTTYLGIVNAILGTNFTNKEDFKKHLQTEYKNMIESVKRYNGFYVGRYETSLSGNIVQSKKDVTPATAAENSANTWYGLYAKQKTYTTESVQGQMIWGSQYDAIMNWLQKSSIDVSSTIPIEGALKNETRITGSVETDKLNNIYDLLGNSFEWLTEADSNNYRINRRR